MLVERLSKVYELLRVLEQPTAGMRTLRLLLAAEDGRYPSRRTFEQRRLKAMPETLPARIACLGREPVESIEPWARCGRAAALDSTLVRARGGVWHKKDREKGEVPHTSSRHRGASGQVRLARVGLRLEAAPGMHRGGRVDATRRAANPRQRRR
jgi:hypothetical protein